ncbi:MAG: hypothetical protein ACE5F5_09535 [Acidimicrobiia bacterium]
MTLILVAVVAALTYAVNTWKIRMVAKGHILASACFEGFQGFLYLYVLVAILEGHDTLRGVGAYALGAFAGTVIAMVVSRRDSGPLAPHHHDCCPPPENSTKEAEPVVSGADPQ